MVRSTLIVCALASFAALVATPAAAESRQASHARIAYADLNLSSPSGAAAFDARVRAAARQACDDRSGPMTLRERQSIQQCRRAFTASVRLA